MALTDQPYLPLYVNDWMNNNKLKMCSPAAHGVMIQIMCLMHKEAAYGTILLKQKYKQTDNQIHNFALQVARLTPFDLVDVEPALTELIEEKVLQMIDDAIVCPRMVSDAEISAKRALAGKNGGKKTQNIARTFAKANKEANTEYENENKESESLEYLISRIRELESVEISDDQKNLYAMIVLKMVDVFMRHNPDYFFHKETDYHAALQIAYHIAEMKKWKRDSVLNGNMDECVKSWETIVLFIKADGWFASRSLADLSTIKEWQRLVQSMKIQKNASKPNTTSKSTPSKSEGAAKLASTIPGSPTAHAR